MRRTAWGLSRFSTVTRSKLPPGYDSVTAPPSTWASAPEPPFRTVGRSGRYATTLYGAAGLLKITDDVDKDMRKLSELSKDQQFVSVLRASILKKEQLHDLFSRLLDRFQAPPLTRKMIFIMIENDAARLVPQTSEIFCKFVSASKKETDITVTFASEPEPKYLEKVKADITRYWLPSNAVPKWMTKVDPALLGGLTISVEGHFAADLSKRKEVTRSKELVERLRHEAAAAKVTPPRVMEPVSWEELQKSKYRPIFPNGFFRD